jgi:hypothetical protein
MGSLMKVPSFLCLSIALVGCHTQREPARPEPGAAESTKAESAKSECVIPTTDAMARFSGVSESDLAVSHDIDFNDDGQSDTIVRVPSGREATHLLYIRERGCIRFLDEIEAFQLGREDGAPVHGYCDLWVETWLMHGDRQRTRMSFIDGAYQPMGEGELIPGPRDRPR